MNAYVFTNIATYYYYKSNSVRHYSLTTALMELHEKTLVFVLFIYTHEAQTQEQTTKKYTYLSVAD